MTGPFDGVDQEEVGMEEEAALLYRAVYDVTSDRSAPAEGFPRDLRRLREQVKAMGGFGRWRLELIDAGIRDAREGRPPRY
jgi:hypothetical protein